MFCTTGICCEAGFAAAVLPGRACSGWVAKLRHRDERALLALSRGGALTFNARHTLACLGAGALTALGCWQRGGMGALLVVVLLHARHALACGRVACAYVLVSILRYCNARHALAALHVGALALDPRHALACACGSALIPGRHVGHVAIGRVPLVLLGRLVRGNARMGNMIVAGTCIRRECGRCAAFLTCWFVLHAFVHERSRGSCWLYNSRSRSSSSRALGTEVRGVVERRVGWRRAGRRGGSFELVIYSKTPKIQSPYCTRLGCG